MNEIEKLLADEFIKDPAYVKMLINDLGVTIVRDLVPQAFEETNENSDPLKLEMNKMKFNEISQRLNALKALKAEDELQRKMELEKERTRRASDMHDDLGAGLTRIKFIAENISEKTKDAALQPDMEKLKTSSIELVENMAEIIWAMNEKNNSLEDLIFYLRSYAVDYCTENGLACEFTLQENIPVKIIGGEVRRNVFLVLKESLHNIVKHAGAKKVTINFQADEKLSLIIADDGRGYEETMHKRGNGLLNIVQRAKALNGKFSISNSSGTVIRFEVPLLLR